MLSDAQRLAMLERPQKPIHMVLDTDAYNEIDDQFAIAYALSSPEVTVEAFYAAPFLNDRSSGPKDGMERSYQEIRKLLGLMGIDRKVFLGSETYLPSEKSPVDSPAARDLCERALAHSPDEPLYVAAIGAITNVASALLMSPEIAERIVVVWLGGNALHWPDNREFNCSQDVAAARVVFDSGVPLVLLPCMGVVSGFTTTEPELRKWLSGKNALCDYLVEHTVEAANQYAFGKVWSRVIWDVTAIGWLIDPDCQRLWDTLIPTPIPEYDHRYSQDPRRPLCRYVYHVQRDALFAHLFSRLTA